MFLLVMVWRIASVPPGVGGIVLAAVTAKRKWGGRRRTTVDRLVDGGDERVRMDGWMP